MCTGRIGQILNEIINFRDFSAGDSSRALQAVAVKPLRKISRPFLAQKDRFLSYFESVSKKKEEIFLFATARQSGLRMSYNRFCGSAQGGVFQNSSLRPVYGKTFFFRKITRPFHE